MKNKCYRYTQKFWFETEVRAKNKLEAKDKGYGKFDTTFLEGEIPDIEEIKCRKDIK